MNVQDKVEQFFNLIAKFPPVTVVLARNEGVGYSL